MRARRGRAAFTLLETLLAVALLAGLLAGAVTILVQVSSAWAAEADDPVLDRHADGLERFLRRILSAKTIAAPTAEQISEEKALLAAPMPDDLPWQDILAVSGGAVTGRLAFDENAGLLLYWETAREKSLALAKPHRVPLSPWVVSARIYLMDTAGEEWTEWVPGETAAGTTSFATARGLRVLRLEIERLGHRRTLQILLPSNAS